MRSIPPLPLRFFYWYSHKHTFFSHVLGFISHASYLILVSTSTNRDIVVVPTTLVPNFKDAHRLKECKNPWFMEWINFPIPCIQPVDSSNDKALLTEGGPLSVEELQKLLPFICRNILWDRSWWMNRKLIIQGSKITWACTSTCNLRYWVWGIYSGPL